MAVDNPTYFSVAGGNNNSPGPTTSTASVHPRGLASFFRRRQETLNETKTVSVTASRARPEVDALGTEEVDGCCLRNGAPKNVQPLRITEEHRERSVQTKPTFGRRSFRNLFRSVSANSEVEKARDFFNGEPRPSDVAPPSPYLPHRSHSHSENDERRRALRKKVLKSASELLSNDMVYCGLASEEAASQGLTTDPEDAEIFLGVDDARYYNVSATLPIPGSAAAGRRRHSIGTFLARSKGTADSPRQPSTVAPPIPTADTQNDLEKPKRSKSSRRRRRKGASSGKGTRTGVIDTPTTRSTDSSIDDIVFISSKESSRATEWVKYFVTRFEEIGSQKQYTRPFRIKEVAIEDVGHDPSLEDAVSVARLQIIIVSPSLLESVDAKPERAVSISRQLSPDKVIAMMLGVDDNDLTETRKEALVSNSDWQKFTVRDDDHEFVNEILRTATTILASPKMHFSIVPKKVKMEHNKVIALLTEPLVASDVVVVVVEKLSEVIKITGVRRRNPYTLQFSVPEKCLDVSIIITIKIIKNGQSLGIQRIKCESRMRELDQILRAYDHPLEFLCQTLGFSSGERELLDTWMVQNFQKNLPPHFNLLSAPSHDNGLNNKNHKSVEEYPTLLHFAARFGLEKLAIQLLECPGSDAACDIRNSSDSTPADLAENAGHAYLAHTLRGYTQMNAFSNMYTYLKDMSESTMTPPLTPGSQASGNDSEGEYHRPKSLNDTYVVPPAARPLTTIPQRSPLLNTSPSMSTATMNDYSPVPTPMPITVVTPSENHSSSSNNSDVSVYGYMKMYPTVLKTLSPPGLSRIYQNTASNGVHHEETAETSRTEGATGTTNGSKNGVKKNRDPQEELLELIYDFKNNVHTISQVEALVNEWKNRHDVQKDFADRQKDVMMMREQYEKVQKLMKSEGKKVGAAFDLFRRVFNKSKHKESKDAAHAEDESSSTSKIDVASIHRPFSSLSVSSSSSSGRTSMVSVCSGTSLGDSGTHSDPEERKHSSAETGELSSYAIPPPARPFPSRFPTARGKPSSLPNHGSYNNVEERPPQPVPRSPINSSAYIEFPSSLPIHPLKPNGTPIDVPLPQKECYPPRELATPSSPDTNAEYLVLLEDGSQDDMRNPYCNVESPPPGMCIPKEYNSLPELPVNPAVPTSNGDPRPVGGEYVETDAIVDAFSDKPETSEADTLFPEYTNYPIPVSENEAGPFSAKQKALPAPPIPPRKKT